MQRLPVAGGEHVPGVVPRRPDRGALGVLPAPVRPQCALTVVRSRATVRRLAAVFGGPTATVRP
jgi:hypothetical protein